LDQEKISKEQCRKYELRSFIIFAFFFTNLYKSNEIIRNKMGQACSRHAGSDNFTHNFNTKTLKGRGSWETQAHMGE
jgi:hypothetical protein